MYADYHIHSEYSDDSIQPIEDIIIQAIQLKIEEICITDHVDFGVRPDWGDEGIKYVNGKAIVNVDYPRYSQEIDSLKEKYKGQIILKKGLEFGIQMHTRDRFTKLFHAYDFDFIILSVHQVDNQEFWTNDFQNGRTQAEYYTKYYQELYDLVCNYSHYSVLGHMDLITRYDNKDGYPSFDNHKEIITKILKKVIETNKGIELNTSSIRYGLDDLTPCRDILKLYYELGGTILTIGSDSHCPDHLGKHIEELKEVLREIGYTHFHTFDKMNPIKHIL